MTAVFCVFVVLAGFNAGTMVTLQIQHYALYPLIGRDDFTPYIRANNRAALVPAVLPAIAALVISFVLVISRPSFMTPGQAQAALLLNLAAFASTFRWQRKLQSEMARTGYDDAKTRLLISTNWIRTIAFLFQALLAMAVLVQSLPR